jgi:thymidine phosphorylase
LNHKVGDYINTGDTLATLYVRNEDIDTKILDDIFVIGDELKQIEPLIYGIVK